MMGGFDMVSQLGQSCFSPVSAIFLFDLFIHNIDQVLDKELLLESLEKPSPTALRVALTKLKQTTGLNIKNLRGVGYILESR